MIDSIQPTFERFAAGADWHDLATRILDGQVLTEQEALAILQSHDDELLDLLAASFRIRRKYFGRRVQLYFLMNAKSGLCPEDCSYCSQSKVSDAEIPKASSNEISCPSSTRAARECQEEAMGAAESSEAIMSKGPWERERFASE